MSKRLTEFICCIQLSYILIVYSIRILFLNFLLCVLFFSLFLFLSLLLLFSFRIFLSPLPLFQQIISIDQSISQLMVNVPDALAVSIPRVLLTSSSTNVVSQIVQKTWKPQQVITIVVILHYFMMGMIWIQERIFISNFGRTVHW